MLLLAAFLWDGTAKLRAGREAYNIAEEAARAGAGYVDRRAAYTDGRYVVDQAAALRAARSYLTATGYTGSAAPTGAHAIQVRVRVTEPTLFLALIGINDIAVTGTATARLVPRGSGRTSMTRFRLLDGLRALVAAASWPRSSPVCPWCCMRWPDPPCPPTSPAWTPASATPNAKHAAVAAASPCPPTLPPLPQSRNYAAWPHPTPTHKAVRPWPGSATSSPPPAATCRTYSAHASAPTPSNHCWPSPPARHPPRSPRAAPERPGISTSTAHPTRTTSATYSPHCSPPDISTTDTHSW